MKRKWFSIGIIFFFIGVAVAPSINLRIVKASDDNDLVEVTTQACGIKGYGNTTVKLTREQYQNLEQYLVEFRARLNLTSTREEAVPLFKDAVVELEKYGLLPKGMNFERALRLIILRSQENIINLQEKLIYNHFLAFDINSNFFCLVAGKTTNLINFGAFYPLRLLLTLIGTSILVKIIGDFGIMLWAISVLGKEYRSIFFPLYLFGEFSVGYNFEDYFGDIDYYPSTGTIFSLGMFGPRIYSGSFYGQIRIFTPPTMSPVGFENYYSGMIGFRGLNIRTSEHGNSLIGSCLFINLGPSPP